MPRNIQTGWSAENVIAVNPGTAIVNGTLDVSGTPGMTEFFTSSTTTPFTLTPGTITDGTTLTLGVAGGAAARLLYFVNSTSLAVGDALTANSILLGSSHAAKTVNGIVTDGVSSITLGSSFNGHLIIKGSASGQVDITVPSSGHVGSSWELTLPADAGSAGQAWLSGGGGGTQCTWGSVLVASNNLSDVSSANTSRVNVNQGMGTLVTSGATISTDASLGNVFQASLTNATGPYLLANPTNLLSGATYIWNIDQPGTATTMTYGNKFLFALPYSNASPPPLSVNASGKNTLTCVCDAAGNLRCALITDFG